MTFKRDPLVRELATVACLGLLLMVGACGGGGNDASFTAANVQSITVGPGPSNNINLLFTTVQICTPGSSTCQSIDHVLVDTGSTGLRIVSSLFSSSVSLGQQTDAVGNPIAECGEFANGFTWGPVKIADVRMAQELAHSVPIQVIDPAFSAVPSACSKIGSAMNTAQSLGANGVLGIGLFQQDCGTLCAQSAGSIYYACPPASVCHPVQASLAQQLQNPVGLFAIDNNGFIIALPSVPAMGAASVNGSLIFGIGTQSNNALANAQLVAVNPNTGTFSTILNNTVAYPNSFVDSGSNALYFKDANIPACNNPDFDCPASLLNLSATVQGSSGTASIVNFSVANAQNLFLSNPTFFAFSNLAGTNSEPTRFDWGLPFFFGRRVFTAIDGKDTPAGQGPYIAY